MNNETLVVVVVAAAVLFAVVLGIWFASRNKRSQKLREKFGPEYELAMEKEGSQRTAEQTLKEREKRVNKLDIRVLNPNERDHYHTEWVEIQADFVDDPSKSLEKANRLITEVMLARGFPVADFEQRAEDVSVMHPDFVSNYRNANVIVMKNKTSETTTEELRQAMVYYRSLFDELLGPTETKEKEAVIQ